MEKYSGLTRGKLILIILILIIILSLLFSFNIKIKNSDKKYKNFEKEMQKQAEKYLGIMDVEIDDGEQVVVNLNDLKSRHLLFDELSNKCKGYVIASSEKNISADIYEIEYRAYIKCGRKYNTPNYSSSYENK